MIGVVFTGVVVVAVVVPGVVVSNVVALCEASAKLRGCAAKVTTESRLLTPYALVAARAVRATADACVRGAVDAPRGPHRNAAGRLRRGCRSCTLDRRSADRAVRQRSADRDPEHGWDHEPEIRAERHLVNVGFLQRLHSLERGISAGG
ncbi:MAG: hypothetical protein JF623_00715 [Acidobacteria bacterium]|nr:hypothetical protein [Acidobacteriota bacterium]